MKTTRSLLSEMPRTPISQHLAKIHEILLFLYGQTDGYSVNAVEMAEHSLREIGIASLSMMDPEEAYREQMRWQYGATPRYGQGVVSPPGFTLNVEDVMASARETMRRAFADVTKAVSEYQTTHSPSKSEWLAQKRYERAIEAERKKGMAHIFRESARIRTELNREIRIRVPHNKARSEG